jgi:NadR type nicotinamide-nucleotide adenylyltransferase
MSATRKIVVIGPESTGKSTLSEALAAELNTLWVPEQARGYLDTLDLPYAENDLLKIARIQTNAEDALMPAAGDLLICDTDLYVLKVWSEHRFARCHKWILETIATRRYDLYLLTFIDTEWQPDPQREHPEKHMREYFYRQYLDIVSNSGVPWADVRGTHQQRMNTALSAIDSWRATDR